MPIVTVGYGYPIAPQEAFDYVSQAGGGKVVFEPGTYETDAGWLIDGARNVEVDAARAVLRYTGTDPDVALLEFRSCRDFHANLGLIEAANTGSGIGVLARRPSNAGRGYSAVSSVIRGRAEGFAVGFEVGRAGEGQANNVRFQEAQAYDCTVGFRQDGEATETILYDNVLVSRNVTHFDLRSKGALFLNPATGGIEAETHWLLGERFRNLTVVGPAAELKHPSGSLLTIDAAYSPYVQFIGGYLSIFGVQAGADIASCLGAGELRFDGTMLYSETPVNWRLRTSGLKVSRRGGAWTNVTLAGATGRYDVGKVEAGTGLANVAALTGAPSGQHPTLEAVGKDANVDLRLQGKGSGGVSVYVSGVGWRRLVLNSDGTVTHVAG